MNDTSIAYDYRYHHSNYLRRYSTKFKQIAGGILTTLETDLQMELKRRQILENARLLFLEMAEECRIGMGKSKARENHKENILKLAVSVIDEKFSKLTSIEKFVFMAMKERSYMKSCEWKNENSITYTMSIDYNRMLKNLSYSIRDDYIENQIPIEASVRMELEYIYGGFTFVKKEFANEISCIIDFIGN